jgi:hypothetical protein
MLGGIIGGRVGRGGIPPGWVRNLLLWPRPQLWFEAMAASLARTWKYLGRNVWFDALVLLPGVRRLLPPY